MSSIVRSTFSIVFCVFIVLLVSTLLPLPTEAIYFHIIEGQPKCFIEEVPADTLVVATYKNPDFIEFGKPEFTGVGVKVIINDPNGLALVTKNMETNGKFAFTSTVGGEHNVCFQTNSSRWFGQPKKFRFDLRLDVGEMGIDYTEVAKREHLTELEVEVRRLNDKVKDILKEQGYQREREIAFRNTSESTNARVVWWSIIQMMVMAVSTFFTAFKLQDFLKVKKVV